MKLNYLCATWKSLIEQVVNLIGNGYVFVHVMELNPKKADKFLNTDLKLMKKYNAFYNKLDFKDRYYRRKQKGVANFRYLRWENIAVVLHTKGKIIVPGDLITVKDRKGDKKFLSPEEAKTIFRKKFISDNIIQYEEGFTDVRQNPIFLEISDEVVFDIAFIQKIKREEAIYDEKGKFKEKGKEISRKEQVTVKFSKKMFRAKQIDFAELIENKARAKILFSFNEMLNNFPSWRGIIHQKYQMKKYILAKAKKHQFKIEPNLLEVKTFRKKQEIIFLEVFYDLKNDNLFVR